MYCRSSNILNATLYSSRWKLFHNLCEVNVRKWMFSFEKEYHIYGFSLSNTTIHLRRNVLLILHYFKCLCPLHVENCFIIYTRRTICLPCLVFRKNIIFMASVCLIPLSIYEEMYCRCSNILNATVLFILENVS